MLLQTDNLTDSTVTTIDSHLGADFSIWGMFMAADPIVKAVMILLVLASIWSWSIIIEKSITMGSIKSKARKFEDLFWSGKPLDDLYNKMKDRADHPMAKVFVAAMGEWDRTKTSGAHADTLAISARDRIEKVMNVTISRELEKTERQMSVLATIGSSAPFVGLFGTVWGIMSAFQAIAVTQDTNLAVVAPGIAEALFATALGLVAAIPAVVAYNRYSGAINSYAVRLQGFADEFGAILSRQLDERVK
ncbi:MAG: protein TolQ [bacterium]